MLQLIKMTVTALFSTSTGKKDPLLTGVTHHITQKLTNGNLLLLRVEMNKSGDLR